MTLNEILREDAESVYGATEGLIRLADGSSLDWKPATGNNWMSLGQLLRHCTDACGMTVKGFVTGEWGMPEGMEPGDIPPDEMMPSAESMPSVESIEEAIRLLNEDKVATLELFSGVSEERLARERSAPPWGGSERTLFQHLHEMIWHLAQHKGQLFYYLKLQGKDVNTMHLWMGGA